MAIQPGDVYWLTPDETNEAESGIGHPQVVIAVEAALTVCALTTNLKKASMPGNVLLAAGEANLPKQSIVEVTKVMTADQTRLGAYIGRLDERRIGQILAGMRFVQRSFLERLAHQDDA